MKEVKWIQVVLFFKSINTRGFATVANNTRFMQLVDGMDNASPLLNFVLGNLIEFQRLMFKAWSLAQGHLRFIWCQCVCIFYLWPVKAHSQVGDYCLCKIWTNKSKAAGTNDYVDYGIRMAHAFSPKLAAKANLPICAVQIGMLQTTTTNERWWDRSHVNYDGINVYGDEVTTNIKLRLLQVVAGGQVYQFTICCCF
jgi:hypothetical protein